MTEVNLYYDQIEKDHETMEAFYGGWGTGADPDPWALWGDDTVWNYPRWVNEEANELLKQAVDVEVVGTDQEKRKNLYVEWQKIFNEEVPALPIMELNDVYAISNKVQGVKITPVGTKDMHKWSIKQ